MTNDERRRLRDAAALAVGTQELMLNAEDETRECFETAREYWTQLEREMAECPPFHFSVQV